MAFAASGRALAGRAAPLASSPALCVRLSSSSAASAPPSGFAQAEGPGRHGAVVLDCVSGAGAAALLALAATATATSTAAAVQLTVRVAPGVDYALDTGAGEALGVGLRAALADAATGVVRLEPFAGGAKGAGGPHGRLRWHAPASAAASSRAANARAATSATAADAGVATASASAPAPATALFRVTLEGRVVDAE